MKPVEKFKSEIISIFEQNQDILFGEQKNSTDPQEIGQLIIELKEFLMCIGRSVLKDKLESMDSTVPAFEHDNKLFRSKYNGPKQFVSVLGEVTLNRTVYQADRGGKTYCPLDKAVGISNDYVSPDLKELLLYASSHNTPKEVSELFDKLGITKLHESTIREICLNDGKVIESNHEAIFSEIRSKETMPEPDILVASLDGVNVLTREAGAKQGRPKERPGMDDKPPSSSYKNATCGSLAHYKINSTDKGLRAERLNSIYHANMPEHKAINLKARLEEEIKYAITNQEVKIMLCDGHRAIWNYVENTPLYADFHLLIDFFHASEHLSVLAEQLFGKASEEGKSWYRKMADKLKYQERGVGKVIRSAKYYLKTIKLSKAQANKAIKEFNYFKNNKGKMDYYKFVKKGWPIGSGVIEAACKSIVKQRMCRSGQRWSNEGGQPILDMRSTVKSGRWNAFWKQYADIYYGKSAA